MKHVALVALEILTALVANTILIAVLLVAVVVDKVLTVITKAWRKTAS